MSVSVILSNFKGQGEERAKDNLTGLFDDVEEEVAGDIFSNDSKSGSESVEEAEVGSGIAENAEEGILNHFTEEVEQEEVQLPPIEESTCIVNRKIGENAVFVKLPGFISMDQRPFDPETFKEEEEKEEYYDELGRLRVKLKADSVIRWRNGQNESGQTEPQTNAHIVKWSDGTQSIVVGDTVLNCPQKDVKKEHNYLYQSVGQFLMGHKLIEHRLLVEPPANSATHTQVIKKLNSALGARTGIMTQFDKLNPYAAQKQYEKEQQALERQWANEETKRRRNVEYGQRKEITSSYLEDNDDEEMSSTVARSRSSLQKKDRRRAEDADSEENSGEGSDSDDSFIARNHEKESDSETEKPEKAKPLSRVIHDDDEDEKASDKEASAKPESKRRRVIAEDDDANDK